MATTTNFGIYYPVTGDALTPLESRFASLAQSVDDALNAGYWRFGGLDATRIALSGVKLKEGITWYSTDTNREWFYDGTSWLMNMQGLNLIIPGSVTNATISSDGAVIPTAGATTVSFNNVFSSRFRRYLIEFYYATPANSGSQLRLRAAGVDSTASSYAIQNLWASGSTPTAGALTSQTLWTVAAVGGLNFSGTIHLSNPAISASTKMLEAFVNTAAAGGVGITSAVGHNGVAGVFDGFTFILSSSSFSADGYFKIYGMA